MFECIRFYNQIAQAVMRCINYVKLDFGDLWNAIKYLLSPLAGISAWMDSP